MERNWATKDCWFRLLTTIVGMTVVDMHRWYGNLKSCTTIPLLQYEYHEINDEIMVRKCSDMLCANLQPNLLIRSEEEIRFMT